MPRRSGRVSANTTQRRIKAGRGQGTAGKYLPWLTTHDVSSEGTKSRTRGIKTGRTHHLFSYQFEYTYFCVLDLSPLVIDIQEQFPLDLGDTLDIAKQLRLRYPCDRQTKAPIVLTTDFLVTMLDGGATFRIARTLKPTQKLTKRTLEKFEIERIYWEIRNIDWGIVTKDDIPEALGKNCRKLHFFWRPESCRLQNHEIQMTANFLSEKVKQFQVPLSQLCRSCDHELELPIGASLRVAHHLIATRQWLVDLTILIQPEMPLDVLDFRLSSPDQ